jgi:hypothetical protein
MARSAATIARGTIGDTAYALEPAMPDDNAAMTPRAVQVLDEALYGLSAKDRWALLAAIEAQMFSYRVRVVQLAVYEESGRNAWGAQKRAAHVLGAKYQYVRSIISRYGPGGTL